MRRPRTVRRRSPIWFPTDAEQARERQQNIRDYYGTAIAEVDKLPWAAVRAELERRGIRREEEEARDRLNLIEVRINDLPDKPAPWRMTMVVKGYEITDEMVDALCAPDVRAILEKEIWIEVLE